VRLTVPFTELHFYLVDETFEASLKQFESNYAWLARIRSRGLFPTNHGRTIQTWKCCNTS